MSKEKITTIDDVAPTPAAPAVLAQQAIGSGHTKDLSGDLVEIVLSAGEGLAGKEGQFVRVNDYTCIVPRNTPVVVPVEVLETLRNAKPQPDPDGNIIATPRFAVSELRHIKAAA